MPSEPEPPVGWHRIFGRLLMEVFENSPYLVELERDLSEQQQFLDVIIIRSRPGHLTVQLPDGMADLKPHNLITFKSRHESLDPWAMKELVGHYVAYRKLVSKRNQLLPEDQFRLYAVCSRFPQHLSKAVPWKKQQEGVYDYVWGTDEIRVIVAGELAQEPRNAPLHLFSASSELVGFGFGAFQQDHQSQTSRRVLALLQSTLNKEGFTMSFTKQDFEREYFKAMWPMLSPEEQKESLEGVPLATRLAGLTEEEVQQYFRNRDADNPAAKRKPKVKKRG